MSFALKSILATQKGDETIELRSRGILKFRKRHSYAVLIFIDIWLNK